MFYAIPTCKKNWCKKILKKCPGGGGGGVDFHCNSKKPIDVHFFLISFHVVCYFEFFWEILKSPPSLTG